MKDSGNHIRCQIEYERGKENYRKNITNIVRPVVEADGVDSYYFLWQNYSEKFEHHIQLDLILEESAEKETVKSEIEQILEDQGRKYYWEKDFPSSWCGLNSDEKDLLLEARCKNAEIALKTLKYQQRDQIKHKPAEFVNRNHHLTCNMHGMTYWDEIKFCIKRPIEILGAKILPDYIYNKIYLKRETRDL